jgi:hypothetical protein
MLRKKKFLLALQISVCPSVHLFVLSTRIPLGGFFLNDFFLKIFRENKNLDAFLQACGAPDMKPYVSLFQWQVD